MCGIVASAHHLLSIDDVLSGLKHLEYRGYDSAGIAYWDRNHIQCIKAVGKVHALEEKLSISGLSSCSIGHTRWATHGSVSIKNAHPQISEDQKIYVVHNGIIKNVDFFNKNILSCITFTSMTDTERIANLLSVLYKQSNDFLLSIQKAMQMLDGSFALAILCADYPHTIFFAKRQSPLLLGKGKDISMLASDIHAMNPKCLQFMVVPEEHYGYIKSNEIRVFCDGKEVSPTFFSHSFDSSEIEKGNYMHFMEKEIEEQPIVIERILNRYVDPKTNQITLSKKLLKSIQEKENIIFVACGTSYHACLIGKRWLNEVTRKNIKVFLASEFPSHFSHIFHNSCFIFLSQSGETADLKLTLNTIRNYKDCPIYTLTNVSTSSLARDSDDFIDLCAGAEISVASTKAYLAELCVLYLIASTFKDNYFDTNLLLSCKQSIQDTIQRKEKLFDLAKQKIYQSEHCFFIGKNYDFDLCLEGALKMKEVSYIHAEAFAAGELKHGPIALIQKGIPVIACISSFESNLSTRINLQETISRGSTPIVISTELTSNEADDFVVLCNQEELSPIVFIPVLQYLAYYCAYLRKVDIDQPRNLAKSVTVE